MAAMELTRMVTIRGVQLWALLLALVYREVLGQAPERRYACWGSFGPPVVSAQCPRNTVIQVIRAGLKVQSHGGLCTYNDNDCGCEYGQEGCQMQDVRQLCMGRPACRLDVTQQYISTATCKGFSDYMYIEFNCVPVEHNSVSDICSAVQTKSEHGFLRSPNYPGVSRAMRECDCTLTTDDDSSIELTVLDFQTGEYDCDHDKLLVAYDGRTDEYCGEKSEKTTKRIASKSSVVSVKFDTDGKGVGGSFWLKYEAAPKADVKLICSYKETEITTLQTIPPTTEETTFTSKTTEAYRPSPRFYTPRKPIRENIRVIEEKTFDNSKIPWWKKVMENVEKTKKMNKPTPKPVLVDSPKSLDQPTRTTSISTTTTDQHYHQYQNKHPKFIQANQGKFPTAGKLSPLPASFHSYVDNSGRRWSHLPKSLLSKLQFPLPVIKALEKKLVPDAKKLQQPYLRILPELLAKKPMSAPSQKSNSAYLSDHNDPRLSLKDPRMASRASRLSTQDTITLPNFFTGQSHNRPIPEGPDVLRNSPKKSLKLIKTASDIELPKSLLSERRRKTARKPVDTYSAKTAFPKPRKPKKQPAGKRKKKTQKLKPVLKETSSKETVHYFEHLATEAPSQKKKENKGRGRKSQTKVSPAGNDLEVTLEPSVLPEPVPTTPMYVSKKIKPLRKSSKRTKKFRFRNENDKKKDKSKRPRDKLKADKMKSDTPTKYKTPTSKEAIQPSWEEPLDFPVETELKPYPKVKSKFKARSRTETERDRKKQRKKTRKSSRLHDEEISKIVPKKNKPKRIWKERSDKTKVSVVRPEAKMYVPMTRSQRRKQRRKKQKLNDKRKEKKALLKPIPTTTTSTTEKTTTTTTTRPTVKLAKTTGTPIGSSTMLRDSVHNDVVVVEELAGKVETVSDFYKTLNEEDWTQWPAFEMVKNAQEQQSKAKVNSNSKAKGKQKESVSKSNGISKSLEQSSKSQSQSKSKHRWKVVRPPPTTPKTPVGAAPTPPHTMQTAQPAMLANSHTLDSSIAEMPKSTKVSTASRKIKKRRPPTRSVKADFIPNKSESLTNPKDNMITIIAACVVASILMVIVLGIVIRFVVNRKQDNRTAPIPKAKRYKQQSVADFPIQKIPRPKRI